MPRILLIDDDRDLCSVLSCALEREGFVVEAVFTGDQGLQRGVAGDYDLVLLDVMLPGMDGFEVLRRLRAKSGVHVLMLTARGDDIDRIVGLEIGADDYLPKPFNVRELVARARAILRRARPADAALSGTQDAGLVRVGDIEFDSSSRTVLREGRLIELTSTEFDVLGVLLRSAGRVVSRDEIAQSVLGRKLGPFERTIDMHISKLRLKLGSLQDGRSRITTVRSAGYLYAVPNTWAGGWGRR
ncbi:MAG: response regulator transcription factor [Silvibacterium sp.]|nr:response regulator transcription factor [Silvibacterium sp.]